MPDWRWSRCSPIELEDHFNALTRHYSRSDNAAKAVDFLGRAGTRGCAASGADSEAIGLFSPRLWSLLQTVARRHFRALPSGTGAAVALSESSFVAIGLRAFEREPALVRARELSERLGDNVQLDGSAAGACASSLNQRDFGTARELAERVLVMSEQADAPAILAGTHSVLGLVQLPLEISRRRVSIANVRSSLSLPPLLAKVVVYLLNRPQPPSCCRDFSRISREGAQQRRRATGRRTSIHDPSSLVFALLGDGLNRLASRHLYGGCGGAASRRDAFHRDRAYNPSFLILAAFLRGWVMVTAGRAEEGIAEMRRSICPSHDCRSVTGAIFLPFLRRRVAKTGALKKD